MDFSGFDIDFDVDLDFGEIEFGHQPITEQVYAAKQFDQGYSRTLEQPHSLSTCQPNQHSANYLDLFESNLIEQMSAEEHDVGLDDLSNGIQGRAGTALAETPGVNFDIMSKNAVLSHEKTTLSLAQRRRPRDVLKAWVAQHPKTLYPDEMEKKSLSNLVGLTVKQVSIWFANHRQRRAKPVHVVSMQNNDILLSGQDELISSPNETRWDTCGRSDESHLTLSHHVVAPSSPQRPLSALNVECDNSDRDQDMYALILTSGLAEGLDFVTAWRTTLPADDCYDSFQDAHDKNLALEYGLRFGTDIDFVQAQPSETWSIGPYRTATEVMSSGYSGSSLVASQSSGTLKRSGSEIDQSPSPGDHLELSDHCHDLRRLRLKSHDGSSVFSAETTSSVRSHRSSVSRRGRRISQFYEPRSKPWQCTVCNQGFVRKTDLNRHVQTICDPAWGWVCGPTAHYRPSTWPDDVEGRLPLCFCGLDPRECEHRMLRCWDRMKDERTFFRLDHFRKHLRDTHGLGLYVDVVVDFERLKQPL